MPTVVPEAGIAAALNYLEGDVTKSTNAGPGASSPSPSPESYTPTSSKTSVENDFQRDGSYQPIAIVGMAMRLPGGVRTEKAFWDMIVEKRDGGYFLQEDPAEFDAGFFGISNYEAARLDPQQRLLLEVVWECMEGAGQKDWQGKNIGCYVGVFGEDWLDMSSKDTQQVDRFHVLGTGNFALSNRISYEYDLTGPR
ncbi:thiolase-like protein [Aspergillus spectabilis]